MRRSSAAILAAVLTAGIAAPALAAWDPIGTVEFSNRNRYDTVDQGTIRGDAILLTARNSDVMCRSVTATFANGRTRDIFRGELVMGRPVTLDLPGGDRNIDRVDFDCRPLDRRRAWVDVAANNDEYYRNPIEGAVRGFFGTR